MERQPDSHRANYYASDQFQNPRIYGNRETLDKSFNKRKSIDDSDDYQNKRRCGSMWTASTSTSIHSNENPSYLETNWNYNQNALLNRLEHFHGTCALDQVVHSYPHRFISLMYQLELSVLCLLRKYALTNSTEPAIFKRSKVGQFNSIILCFKGEYFCIKVLHVDTHYITKCLNFNSFFSHGNLTLSIYLNEFAIELLCYLDSVADAPKYLIIYTNCALDLTNDKQLYRTSPEECNLIQLSSVTSETDPDLIDLLTSNGEKNCEFYRFANDAKTANQLSHFLNIKGNGKNELIKKRISEEEIRHIFSERLIFAVNQPTIEELVETVRTQVRNGNEDFVEIRKEVINQLISDEEMSELGNYQSTIYTFHLFMFSIHDMFLYENISAIKFDERIASHSIAINSRNNFLYFRPLEVDISKLPLNEFDKQKPIFFINSLFSFFYRELNQDVEYFVIFTNASLTLVKELIVGGEFDPSENIETEKMSSGLKFCRLNAMEEKYFMFRHSFIDANNLYQFSRGETRNIIRSLLQTPHCSQRGKFSHLNDNQVKELFMDKIVFAVRQFNSDEMYKVLERELEKDLRVPYDFKELHRVALHYLKSHKSGALTKELLITLGDNLRNKSKDIQNTIFEEEIEFARRVIMLHAPEFGQFVNFLTEGEGKLCLNNLRRNGVNPSFMASIIDGSDGKDVQQVFIELYNVLFDQEGNKSKILKIFEGYGFSVDNISNMLNGSGLDGPKTLVSLYELWFDNFGNPTNCLRNLQSEGVNLSHISVLLSNSRTRCVYIFKTLYSLWFHENGTKTQCLKNLEQSGINLTIIFQVLHKSWESFENLYNFWFERNGHKTVYLERLEAVGVSLNQVCRVIKGSDDVVSAFEKLYNLWFDSQGRKTLHLLTLENEGVNLASVFDILLGTGSRAARIFIDLYSHWFSNNGKKTWFLKTLEAKGRPLPVICRLLSGEGLLAEEKLKSLDSVNSPMDRLISQMACKQEVEYQQTRGNSSSARIAQEANRGPMIKCENSSTSKKMQETNPGPSISFEDRQRRGIANSSKMTRESNRSSAINVCQEKRGITNLSKMTQETNRGSLLRPDYLQINNNSSKMTQEMNRDPPMSSEYQQTRGNTSLGVINLRQNKTEFRETEDIIIDSNSENGSDDEMESNGEGSEDSDEDFDEEEKGGKKADNFQEAGKMYNERELTRKLNRLFKLFGNLKKKRRKVRNSKKNIKRILPIINNQKSLDTFLQDKMMNRKIDAGAYADLSSIGAHCPLTEDRVHQLLRGPKKLCNRELKYQVKFAKIIFDDENCADFDELTNYLSRGQGKWYLNVLTRNKILSQHVAAMFRGCKSAKEVIRGFQELFGLWFDNQGQKSQCLRHIFNTNFPLRFYIYILGDSGVQAVEAFKSLYHLLINENGEKSYYLSSFEKNGVKNINIYGVFKNSGAGATEAFHNLYYICFDQDGSKSRYLKKLEERQISLHTMMLILKNTASKCCQVFEKLYNAWFDCRGNLTGRVQSLGKCGLSLAQVATFLIKKGEEAPKHFEILYNFVFDGNGVKQEHIRKMEKEIDLKTLFKIVCAYDSDVKYLKELYDLWFDSNGSKKLCLRILEENGVDMKFLSTLLHATGLYAYVNFNNLFSFFFKADGQKKATMRNVEQVLDLRSMLEMVTGSKTKLYSIVQQLYYLWFNKNGEKSINLLILEQNGISLMDVSRVLGGSGIKAAEKFKEIVLSAKNDHLTRSELFIRFKQ